MSNLGDVDQIAVVRQRQTAQIRIDDHRLGVLHAAGAGRRVPRMADRERSAHLGQVTLVEDMAYQADAGQVVQAGAIGSADARTLLAAVLQGEQTEKCQSSWLVAWGVDPDDTALLPRFGHGMPPSQAALNSATLAARTLSR